MAVHPAPDRPFLDADIPGEVDDADHGLSPRDVAEALIDPGHPARPAITALFEAGFSGYRGSQEELIREIASVFEQEAANWERFNG
ncbi:hypothetical protein [Nocardia sp. SYP-A9097]|uniref:hypothetical protein n=1 Tax=Nocardia sp. SYP-A9097 TaxID=2663237 RepID=UPI00129A2F1A|nr:hypothetical protein [Nocardia sp. SYP-A9097]